MDTELQMQDLLLLPISHYLLTALAVLLVSVVVGILLRNVQRNRWQVIRQQEIQSAEGLHLAQCQSFTQRLHEKEIELAKLSTESQSRNERLDRQQDKLTHLEQYEAKYLQLEARLDAQACHQEQERKLLEETKLQLFKEFELAANKLFESKHQQFSQSSRAGMEQVLTPFREQLREFHKRVDDVYHKENSERNQLVGQIVELQKQAQQVGQDANNLAAALKGDNKLQGNWGEVILERVLEESGLQKGREYETQKTYSDELGKRYKPDVIVHLPEDKDIIIDAKVSLIDFQRYCQAEEDHEKQSALKRHIESMRTHVRELANKRYDQLVGVRSLDFVFIFVPIEPAFSVAMQYAPALFKEAYDKNIVLVSPSSLMVALRTVETLWRYEKQNRNAEVIALSAGKLYDQFVMIVEAIDELGKQLDKTKETYTLTKKRLSSGRGNLVRRIEMLRDLGAKTSRTLPSKLVSEATEAVDVRERDLLSLDNDKVAESESEIMESEL